MKDAVTALVRTAGMALRRSSSRQSVGWYVDSRNQGIGVLLAEQDQRFGLSVADRGYLMEKGRIRHEAPAALLVDRDELRRYLGV